MRLDKDRIKELLTKEDVRVVMTSLGSKEPIRGYQYQTICHGGGKHKLEYYNDNRTFHCYTDCSKNMDIYEIVINVHKQKGIHFTLPDAIKYVAQKTGKYYYISFKDKLQDSHIVDDWEWINKLRKKDKINTSIPIVNECILDVFIRKPHEEWIDEISYETQLKYDVCYYFKDNRIVTPHRDINGNLIGLTGRALNQEDIDNGKKYMPIMVENKVYSFPTMFNLYGLNKTKEAVSRLKKAAIFESQKSVMKCEDYYSGNNFAVATCSSNISNFQRDLLLNLGIEEVFICFDKFREQKTDETDEQYQEEIEQYQERLKKLAHKFSPFVRVYIVWDFNDSIGYKDSPADSGKEVLESLLKQKIEINTNDEVIE